MSSDKKDTVYTAVDIELYLSGNLSARQMHELEKAALDDPFLAEAIEGYEGMKEKDWKNQLAVARKQIVASGATAKVIPLHRSTRKWWKTAAAVLIVGCGTALTFILTNDSAGDKSGIEIAQKITSPEAPKTVESESPVPPGIHEEQYPASTLTENKVAGKDLISTTDNQTKKPDDNLSVSSGKAGTGDRSKSGSGNVAITDSTGLPVTQPVNKPAIAATNMAPSTEDVEKNKAKETEKLLANNEGLLNRQAAGKKEQAPVHHFNAQVVGTDNVPLPFANISIKEQNFETYADVKGNFRLVSVDTLLTIEVKSVGYLSKTFPLRRNQQLNKIVLDEDQLVVQGKALQPDKVFAGGRKRRASSVLADSIITAEPADGWENYNTYVANNIPDVFIKNEFHGEVEILFDVTTSGTITNIRLKNSLGDTYDEAAKKLIQQGPQWKVKKGKLSPASIKVKF